MTERVLSELQKEYRNFFLGKLNLYGVKSPAELKTKENKSKFFTEIKEDWAKIKLAKKQKKEAEKRQHQTVTTEREISKTPTVKKEPKESTVSKSKKPTHQDKENKGKKEYQPEFGIRKP